MSLTEAQSEGNQGDWGLEIEGQSLRSKSNHISITELSATAFSFSESLQSHHQHQDKRATDNSGNSSNSSTSPHLPPRKSFIGSPNASIATPPSTPPRPGKSSQSTNSGSDTNQALSSSPWTNIAHPNADPERFADVTDNSPAEMFKNFTLFLKGRDTNILETLRISIATGVYVYIPAVDGNEDSANWILIPSPLWPGSINSCDGQGDSLDYIYHPIRKITLHEKDPSKKTEETVICVGRLAHNRQPTKWVVFLSQDGTLYALWAECDKRDHASHWVAPYADSDSDTYGKDLRFQDWGVPVQPDCIARKLGNVKEGTYEFTNMMEVDSWKSEYFLWTPNLYQK